MDLYHQHFPALSESSASAVNKGKAKTQDMTHTLAPEQIKAGYTARQFPSENFVRYFEPQAGNVRPKRVTKDDVVKGLKAKIESVADKQRATDDKVDSNKTAADAEFAKIHAKLNKQGAVIEGVLEREVVASVKTAALEGEQKKAAAVQVEQGKDVAALKEGQTELKQGQTELDKTMVGVVDKVEAYGYDIVRMKNNQADLRERMARMSTNVIGEVEAKERAARRAAKEKEVAARRASFHRDQTLLSEKQAKLRELEEEEEL